MLPVVFVYNAANPTAVLLVPIVLRYKAVLPTAVLYEPVVFCDKDW